MIINLTANLNNFTKSEMSSLDTFLMKMSVKGELEGIVIEMLSEREGIIRIEDNQIKAALPDGIKKGDAVSVKVDRKDNNLVFTISPKGKPIINAKIIERPPLPQIPKDDVYHIKIPQKIDMGEVVSTIKNEAERLTDGAFDKLKIDIENFIKTSMITVNDELPAKDLAENIQKFIKNSGIYFENKLSDIPEKTDGASDIKDDVKYKVNVILDELTRAKQNGSRAEQDIKVMEKAILTLKQLDLELEIVQSKEIQNEEINIKRIVMNFVTNIPAETITIDNSSTNDLVSLLMKIVGLMKSSGDMPDEILSKLTQIIDNIDESMILLKESATCAFHQNLQKAFEELITLKDMISAEKTLAEQLKLPENAPENRGKVSAEEVSHDINNIRKVLQTLTHDLTKTLDTQKADVAARSESARTIDTLIKSFNKLSEGVEFQQLSNSRTPDGNVNYVSIPVMFDDTPQTAELVISHRKSKNSAKNEKGESRVEVFLNMKNIGSVKVDFNVTGKNISGDFYSMEHDTVQLIDNELPTLKEKLAEKDFNIVRVNSKKMRKGNRCELSPDDNLVVEELKIFDFKV